MVVPAIADAPSEPVQKSASELHSVSHHESGTLAGRIGVLSHGARPPHCTAFCLSPTLIATAGHCANIRARGMRTPESQYRFTIAQPALEPHNRVDGMARSTRILGTVSGGGAISYRTPIGASHDWAILRLHQPVCRAGGPKIAKPQSRETAAPSEPVALFTPRISTTPIGTMDLSVTSCRSMSANTKRTLNPDWKTDFAHPDRLLLHDCNAGPFASGAPLLRKTGAGEFEVVAMHIGIYVRSRVLMRNSKITRRVSSHPVARIAVRSDHFTRPVADLIAPKN